LRTPGSCSLGDVLGVGWKGTRSWVQKPRYLGVDLWVGINHGPRNRKNPSLTADSPSANPTKMLTVLDKYTREALWVAVKPRMGNSEVLEALYPFFLKRGRPEFIRSDNGPEFIAENFQTWLARVEIKPIRIYLGGPGRTVTTSASTAPCAGKFSMLSGLLQSNRHRPSSKLGRNNTIASARIRL